MTSSRGTRGLIAYVIFVKVPVHYPKQIYAYSQLSLLFFPLTFTDNFS